jgi:pimeloyl-ACP methyl ester carboxylesterase
MMLIIPQPLPSPAPDHETNAVSASVSASASASTTSSKNSSKAAKSTTTQTTQSTHSTHSSDESAETTESKRRRPDGGLFARLPVADHLANLEMPVTMLFGDHDWLWHEDIRGICNGVVSKRHSLKAELKILNNAGHHLYLDNAKEFHLAIHQAVIRNQRLMAR